MARLEYESPTPCRVHSRDERARAKLQRCRLDPYVNYGIAVRALVVGNRGDADPGLVGARLAEHGFSQELSEREYPREWKGLAGIDVLLLLGSDWSVYDVRYKVEVAAEVGLVQAAVARGVPVFGICFGAQLVAHALGGSVTLSRQPEVGWHAVSSTSHTELLAHNWFQWHYDVFAPPASLSVVASNDVGPQAVIGKRLFATQFHPEVTVEVIRRWCGGTGSLELAQIQMSATSLIENSADNSASLISRTSKLVDWFLNSVSTN